MVVALGSRAWGGGNGHGWNNNQGGTPRNNGGQGRARIGQMGMTGHHQQLSTSLMVSQGTAASPMSLEDMSKLSTREEELQRRLNIMKEKLIEEKKKTEK